MGNVNLSNYAIGDYVPLGGGTMTGALTVVDNVLLKLGTDSDIVFLNRSTVLNANTALTGVLIGTPVSSALAANSLMISNVTASGDIAMYGNLGGNSIQFVWYDTSAGALTLSPSGSLILMPSGDTDDYFTFSTVANIPTITATGAASLGIGSDISMPSNTIVLNYVQSALGYLCTADAAVLRARDADDNYIAAQVRDNTVAIVEVMRWQGAANPFVQIGRDDTGVGLSSVTDGLVLQMGGLTGNEAAGQGLGMSWKIGNASSEVEERGSIDLVLVTATNASEASRFDFNVMTAGAMGLVFSVPAAGINLASGKVLQVAATQVVGARVVDDRADDVVDATYGAEEAGVLDALRDAMITHGLIAAA